MMHPTQQPEQIPGFVEVPIATVGIDARGRVHIAVQCPFCGAVHGHSGARRFSKIIAPCGGGRYRVRADLAPRMPEPRLVPCRCFPDELCLSCGPDAELLFPAKIFTLAEQVA